jgi:hypothetical protein
MEASGSCGGSLMLGVLAGSFKVHQEGGGGLEGQGGCLPVMMSGSFEEASFFNDDGLVGGCGWLWY